MELNYCYGCMEPLPRKVTRCPHCGYDNTKRRNPDDILPEGSILNGKYLVGKMLGRGGFGVTYLGLELNLLVKVAIKEYFPIGVGIRSPYTGMVQPVSSLSDPEDFRNGLNEFLKEARTLALFNSPYFVHVREFFNENGTAYIVMDYVEGIGLDQEISKYGKMHWQRVLSLMKPLMLELDKMHRLELIHRDIKPGNIRLTRDPGSGGERLILLDFGSARHFISENVTKTYTAMVTAGFSPFEQYSEKSRQGPYTDVYAVCATMYSAITGTVPPAAPDRISGEAELQPLSSFGLDVPEKVEKAIAHGLAIRRADRPGSMRDLCNELEDGVPEQDPEELLYLDAKRLMISDSADDYHKALELFGKIPGWKDSDELAAECRRRIAKLESETVIAEPETPVVQELKTSPSGKNLRIPVLIALVLLAAAGFFVFYGLHVKERNQTATQTAASFVQTTDAEETVSAEKTSIAGTKTLEALLAEEKSAVESRTQEAIIIEQTSAAQTKTQAAEFAVQTDTAIMKTQEPIYSEQTVIAGTKTQEAIIAEQTRIAGTRTLEAIIAEQTRIAGTRTLEAIISEQTRIAGTKTQEAIIAEQTRISGTKTQEAIIAEQTRISGTKTQETIISEQTRIAGTKTQEAIIAEQTRIAGTKTQEAVNAEQTRIAEKKTQEAIIAEQTSIAQIKTLEAIAAVQTMIAETQNAIHVHETEAAFQKTQDAINLALTRVIQTQQSLDATNTKAAEPTATPIPTNTPRPTASNTPVPTRTPTVTPTKRPTATATKRPTSTPTKRPTSTPAPSKSKPAVGSFLYFGSYEQDNNKSNGKESIRWKVLDVQGNKALLLSTQVLDAQQFHNKADIGGGWAASKLRSWMMNDFYNSAFSAREKNAILRTAQRATSKDTSDDYDTVFVLSTEQVKKYLTRTSDRQFSASAYAIKARKVFRGADGYYNWWTRSNHVESGSFWKDQIDIVRKYGEIAYTKPTDADCGILPAVWIDISAYMNL